MNSANMKLLIFCESESQVIDIMLLWRFMSSFDLCWWDALQLQQMFHSANDKALAFNIISTGHMVKIYHN